jgi:hypothetical protein
MPKINREEFRIQAELIKYLRARGWHTERIAGGAFQYGLPDLFCAHRKWGQRWIELKRPGNNYSFTRAQKQKFPILDKYGVGIWILTGADQPNYDKLFKPPNWRDYWKKTWKMPTEEDIDKMIEDMWNEDT